MNFKKFRKLFLILFLLQTILLTIACGNTVTITYILGNEIYISKDELCQDYFSDFYHFINDHEGKQDLEKVNIKNEDDFVKYCLDWDADNGELRAAGNTFSKYYLTAEIGGVIENQPTSTFIGFCYQNGKYLKFIPFLDTFFMYWRIDEGYTKSDPNGEDFYASPWASLVDTCKFFYFNSKTILDKYAWFTSERIHEALDNFPGLIRNEGFKEMMRFDKGVLIELPELDVVGYKFEGWYTSSKFTKKIETINYSKKVYAKLTAEGGE